MPGFFAAEVNNMDSVDSAKNIEPVAKGLGSKYNFQHFVFVTKYRYKMFRNPKAIGVTCQGFSRPFCL